MESRKPSNSSKTTRGRKAASTAKPRKRTAPVTPEQVFNIGQVHLLIDLMHEFAPDLEVPSLDEDGDVSLTLSSDMPGLEAFMQFKLDQLRRQQEVLEALWNLG